MNHPRHDKKKNDQETADRRTELLADIRATFTSPAGKSVLGWLSRSAGHGKPAFLLPAGSTHFDPLAAAFRDGRKSIIDEIIVALAQPEDQPASSKPKAKA